MTLRLRGPLEAEEALLAATEGVLDVEVLDDLVRGASLLPLGLDEDV